MSGWNLLHCPEDWEAYKSQNTPTGLPPGVLVWGRGPQSYPCLVTHLPRPGTLELVVAYVYPNDAKKLMAADPGATVPAASTGPTPAMFQRWVTAQVLTHAWFLVETKIASKEKYEEKLVEMLEAVDLYKKDQAAGLKATGLAGPVLGLGPKTGF